MTTPLAAALLDLYPRDDVAAALTTSLDKRTRNRAIRRVESGEVDPSLATLRQLARRLDCELLIGPKGVDVRPAGGRKLSPRSDGRKLSAELDERE